MEQTIVRESPQPQGRGRTSRHDNRYHARYRGD